jgi:hypothetical protein
MTASRLVGRCRGSRGGARPRGHGRGGRRRLLGLAAVTAVVASSGLACTNNGATLARVDLKVLVINDGTAAGNPATDDNTRAIISQLRTEGVPYREVNLNDPGRPTIDADFLRQSVGTDPSGQRSYYQAVVLPAADPTNLFDPPPRQLSPAELEAIRGWEVAFGIREVVASTNPSAAVGMVDSDAGRSTDGQTATVTPAGLAGPFGYLTGSVPFDTGSFAYPGAGAGAAFTPLVDLPSGTIVGVNAAAGREQLVITTSYSFSQTQFKLLGHGIITWMTRGVHLGYNRSYFTMHIDDVFNSNSRWSAAGHCTPGDSCPPGVTTPDIRMTPDDVVALVDWQRANNFLIDQVFNGSGTKLFVDPATGHDPLTDAYVAHKDELRWVNHTYSHFFLGCEQDFGVIPWKCKTDAAGGTRWMSQAEIVSEINRNKAVAAELGLAINPGELVTGEHSGTFVLPQQPQDNPNLAPAFAETGITVEGQDSSRQPDPRWIGPARALPRYPINVFYNVATVADEINEYNWIFTSAADGGSGSCTKNGFQCVKPIDRTTGWTDVIVPDSARQALRYVLSNDPRPTYAHVSNLAEDRLLYPMLDAILGRYRSLFSADAPIVNQTMTEASATLDAQYAWNTALAQDQAEAYVVGGELHIAVTGSYQGPVPLTVPAGATPPAGGDAFGEAYGGERSAWVAVPPGPAGTALRLPTV